MGQLKEILKELKIMELPGCCPLRTGRNRERGLGLVTTLLFGGLLLAVAMTAARVLPIYYRYFEIESQIRAMANKAGRVEPETIRERLLFEMRIQSIPAPDKNLRVFMDGDFLIISLQYNEPFEISFMDKKYRLYDFKFHPYVKKYISS